ncbi:uncharacterized protein LOC134624376 [Pelmatolapia mariae]|uniref:uncharacterized protein LOC134624149 n=1 Tax=Pelmatolapia mariae TaxID=158779 RepID=UPI002FE52778
MKAAAASLLLLGVCVLLLSAPTVSAGLILEIPPDPVPAGSDVTMRCRQSNGDIITAHFFFNGSRVENKTKSEFIITNVQQSDEGLYSCATDVFGESPHSFLRVRDPSPHLHTRTSSNPVNSPALLSPVTDSSAPPSSSSILILVVAGLVSVVLLVLVVWGVLWRKQKAALHSSSPVHVNCSDVTITQRDTRRAKSPDDPDVIYSDVRTRTSGPDDVLYGEVIFRR